MAAKPTDKKPAPAGAETADVHIAAADITGKKSNYINRVVNDLNSFIDAYQRLKTDRDEGAALDFANADPLVGLSDADLVASGNPQLDRAYFLGGFVTLDAITALLVANSSAHLTALYRFRR